MTGEPNEERQAERCHFEEHLLFNKNSNLLLFPLTETLQCVASFVLAVLGQSFQDTPVFTYMYLYYTYGSTYSRNGSNVPYMQYKMFTFIKLQ